MRHGLTLRLSVAALGFVLAPCGVLARDGVAADTEPLDVGIEHEALATSDPEGVRALLSELGQPEAFGDRSQYTVIHASKFLPMGPVPNLDWAGGGWAGVTATDYFGYWTQLDLPNGALIERVYALVSDTSSDGFWWFEVGATEGGIAGQADYTEFAYGETPGTPGRTLIDLWVDPPVVFRTWTDMNGDGVSDVTSFIISIGGYQSAVGGLGLWGVGVRWSRTVSPAPAAATFADVPTSSSIFRFVEALAAAGITGGCGGGNYCPDTAVTRGQMAVFLASALGLHWPN